MCLQDARAHKKKIDWSALLEAAGLGEDRLVREINLRLDAKVSKFYKGEFLGDFEDNRTRMQATELLADLLGKKKAEIDLNHHLDDGLTLVLRGGDAQRDAGTAPETE